MPVWHEATKELRKNGELVVVGIVQEQHAERARLYAQWKQFDWPILQDQMTHLGLAVVPVVNLIDENGNVQATRFRPKQLGKLLEQPAAARKTNISDVSNPPGQAVVGWVSKGDLALMQKEPGKALGHFSEALKAAEKLEAEKSVWIPRIQFRQGVAYRARFDAKDSGDPSDFANASKCWTKALQGNPNQYIWRRRIEQYGPRNIKPYPFYDWVDGAIKDLGSRGEDPVKLKIKLAGAEVAQPSRKPEASESGTHPDPKNQITKVSSDSPMIVCSASAVPFEVAPGATVRIHLQMKPGKDAKWNNESTPVKIWISESSESGRLLEAANPQEPVSAEVRTIDFEIQTPKTGGEMEITGFVLANVCSDSDGVCVYRRCDFKTNIRLKK